MNRKGEILNMIISAVKKEVDTGSFKLYLYGSQADTRKLKRADFDIGFFGEKALDKETFFRIHDRIEELETLYPVDFIDLRSVQPEFRAIALKQAKVIYKNG